MNEEYSNIVPQIINPLIGRSTYNISDFSVKFLHGFQLFLFIQVSQYIKIYTSF